MSNTFLDRVASYRGRKDKPLGELLHEYRYQHCLTQQALADRLGISRQRLSEWENYGVPKAEVRLIRLAMIGMTIELAKGFAE